MMVPLATCQRHNCRVNRASDIDCPGDVADRATAGAWGSLIEPAGHANVWAKDRVNLVTHCSRHGTEHPRGQRSTAVAPVASDSRLIRTACRQCRRRVADARDLAMGAWAGRCKSRRSSRRRFDAAELPTWCEPYAASCNGDQQAGDRLDVR